MHTAQKLLMLPWTRAEVRLEYVTSSSLAPRSGSMLVSIGEQSPQDVASKGRGRCKLSTALLRYPKMPADFQQQSCLRGATLPRKAAQCKHHRWQATYGIHHRNACPKSMRIANAHQGASTNRTSTNNFAFPSFDIASGSTNSAATKL